MIAIAQQLDLRSSDIVHYVAYAPDGVNDLRLLCETTWLVFDSTYHARVTTEVDPVGRTRTIRLTEDPVDCMTCLVNHGRR